MSLNPRKLRNAVRYNKRHMGRIGWPNHFHRIARLLNLEDRPSPEDFAEAVAKWQANSHVVFPPLVEDGKLGPSTWGLMQMNLPRCEARSRMPAWVEGFRPPPTSPVDPSLGTGGNDAPLRQPATPVPNADGAVVPVQIPNIPDWLLLARRELVHWQGTFEGETDWDGDYFDAVPAFGNRRHSHGARPRTNAHWCAAFVNYCLHTTGYSHTGSSMARSFLRKDLWRFDPIPDPRPGAVVVVGVGGDHIGFLNEAGQLPNMTNYRTRDVAPGNHGGSFKLLGGNQRVKAADRGRNPTQGDADRVTIKNETRLMISVEKGGVTSPYLWPRRGSPGDCNADIPTAHPHFCGKKFSMS